MKVLGVCSSKLGLITFLGMCAACTAPAPPAGQASPAAVARPAVSALLAPAPNAAVAEAPKVALRVPSTPKRLGDTLKVKRFLVAPGVQDREPLASPEPLPANGTAIYAFAELANPESTSENVRITFERKGGKERVGDVSLPVPANVSRHRTWAFTRNIFAAGVWEAVLWSESGAELGRTAFEVKKA